MRGRPEPGAVTCRACNDRAAAWYEQRKAAGLCIDCDNAAVPGKTKCEACLRADVAQMQRLYQQRKAAALCVSCGGQPLLGQVLCADCAKGQKVYVRVKQAKNVANGMCIDCGQAERDTCSRKRAAGN